MAEPEPTPSTQVVSAGAARPNMWRRDTQGTRGRQSPPPAVDPHATVQFIGACGTIDLKLVQNRPRTSKRLFPKPCVVGSNPTGGADAFGIA